MGDENIEFSLEAVQEFKRKVCLGRELSLFEGLVLVAACASNKGDEWIHAERERSKSQENGASMSSALESLRKLNAEKLICKRWDESDDEDHTHLSPDLKKENLDYFDSEDDNALVAQDMIIFTSERDENVVVTEYIRKNDDNDDDDRAFELRKSKEKGNGPKKKYYLPPSSHHEDLPEEYVKYLALHDRDQYFTSKDDDSKKKKMMVSFNDKMQNSSAFKSRRNYGIEIREPRKRSKNDAEDENCDLDSKKSKNSEFKNKNREEKRWKYNSSPNIIHQNLPEKFKGKIATTGGDSDKVQLVSDLKKHQNWLSMPVNQLLCHFSESDEVKRLENTKDEEKKMVSFNDKKQNSYAFSSRRNHGIQIREPRRSYKNDEEDDNYNSESNKSKNKGQGVKRSRPESHKSKNKDNSVKRPIYNSPPSIIHQDLPENFKRKIETMGGDSNKAQLVLQKKLFNSDLEKQQNRLSMPINQLLCNFLEPAEVEWLEDTVRFMDITIIDPMGKEEQVRFKKWTYKKNVKSYVLIKEWCDVAKKNRLRCGDLIQVWAFRDLKNNLHLAIVKRHENNDGTSSSDAANANTSSAGGEGSSNADTSSAGGEGSSNGDTSAVGGEGGIANTSVVGGEGSSNANTSVVGGEGSSNANASSVGGEGSSGNHDKEEGITVGVLVEVIRSKVSSEKSMEEVDIHLHIVN